MKFSATTVFGAICFLVLSGCFRLTDGELIARAQGMYVALQGRYQALMGAQSSRELDQQARIFSNAMHMNFGDALWSSMIGKDYLVHSYGTPLHRAVFFIEKDLQELQSYQYQLERRLLTSTSLYYNVVCLGQSLQVLARVLQAHEHYVEEAQFIEQKKLQKEQLHESQKQTQLLHGIATDRFRNTRSETKSVIIVH